MKASDCPIILDVKPSDTSRGRRQSLMTFSSYSFDRNITIPASPFRFTAEGVDRAIRKRIRSTDLVELLIQTPSGLTVPLATGYIDETDVHVSQAVNEFVLTGRDTLGQLVDNAAVDQNNQIVHIAAISLFGIAQQVAQNTRIPQTLINQGCPSGKLLFQTNPGETKVSALQRYLEFTNCLVWTQPNGQMVVGKPNMAQARSGSLILLYSDPSKNNVLEARVRRNVNTAIAEIAIQQQALGVTDPTPVTIENADPDVQRASAIGAGKSIYRLFTLGNGMDAVNSLSAVGSGGGPQQIGFTLARREIAQSNMHVLEVETVVRGHLNPQGLPFNIDQVYHVRIEDDDVDEDLFVYSVRYDLTPQMGLLTTLKLVKLGTIVADVPMRASP